jgi:hypothetical protein
VPTAITTTARSTYSPALRQRFFTWFSDVVVDGD